MAPGADAVDRAVFPVNRLAIESHRDASGRFPWDVAGGALFWGLVAASWRYC